jgi:nucleoid-associated protein YgaU
MPVLQLDTIQFTVDELPEDIVFGGEQTLAVRKFPGGGKDIQPLGAFDDAISWSAQFMFVGALTRAQSVDALRIAANPVMLTRDSVSMMVVVSKFTYHYQHDYYIPYDIELEPVNSYGYGASVNGTQTASASSSAVSTAAPLTTSLASEQLPVQAQKTHTVVSGDTLPALAVTYYHDGTQWPKIATANNIKDPTTLQIGRVITIP